MIWKGELIFGDGPGVEAEVAERHRPSQAKAK